MEVSPATGPGKKRNTLWARTKKEIPFGQGKKNGTITTQQPCWTRPTATGAIFVCLWPKGICFFCPGPEGIFSCPGLWLERPPWDYFKQIFRYFKNSLSAIGSRISFTDNPVVCQQQLAIFIGSRISFMDNPLVCQQQLAILMSNLYFIYIFQILFVYVIIFYIILYFFRLIFIKIPYFAVFLY